MADGRLQQLKEQHEQMIRLRNDSSLLRGFAFCTLAGDITIDNQHVASLLLDYYIKELRTEIKHEEG